MILLLWSLVPVGGAGVSPAVGVSMRRVVSLCCGFSGCWMLLLKSLCPDVITEDAGNASGPGTLAPFVLVTFLYGQLILATLFNLYPIFYGVCWQFSGE